MPRDSARNPVRERIAHLAARLMAQDGIEDYALAKRKAARQAGLPATRQLPNNDEIDDALRVYRELYESGHRSHLRELRELALAVMTELEHFNPYLTGSVLTGSAGKYAAIRLQLFTDNAKGVEHYLLNRGVTFAIHESRLYAAGQAFNAPVLALQRDNVEIHLTLLSTHDERMTLKSDADGKAIERAKRKTVESLLADD